MKASPITNRTGLPTPVLGSTFFGFATAVAVAVKPGNSSPLAVTVTLRVAVFTTFFDRDPLL